MSLGRGEDARPSVAGNQEVAWECSVQVGTVGRDIATVHGFPTSSLVGSDSWTAPSPFVSPQTPPSPFSLVQLPSSGPLLVGFVPEGI